MSNKLEVDGYTKYSDTIEDALVQIEKFTRIVILYNKEFKRKLDYTINIVECDSSVHKYKIIFNLNVNGPKEPKKQDISYEGL